MSERHVYHYCARLLKPNQEIYIDGLLNWRGEILTMADYRRVKAVIAEDMLKTDPNAAERLTIMSLTPIADIDQRMGTR